MRMAVHEPRMRMGMRVRLARRIVRRVRMTMVRVVHVAMLVHVRVVRMLVHVALGEMEIKPHRHQPGGGDEDGRHRLAEDGDGERHANERRQEK